MQLTFGLLLPTLRLAPLAFTIDEAPLRLQVTRLGLNHLCLLYRQSLEILPAHRYRHIRILIIHIQHNGRSSLKVANTLELVVLF